MGQNGVWAEQEEEEEEEQEEQEEQEEEELTAVQRVCIGATGLRCGDPDERAGQTNDKVGIPL